MLNDKQLSEKQQEARGTVGIVRRTRTKPEMCNDYQRTSMLYILYILYI